MSIKNRNKWISVLLAMVLFCVTSSIVWAKSESKRTVTTQEIKTSAEDYLVSHLDWDPESMDIEVSYDGKDIILPAGNLKLDFGTLITPGEWGEFL